MIQDLNEKIAVGLEKAQEDLHRIRHVNSFRADDKPDIGFDIPPDDAVLRDMFYQPTEVVEQGPIEVESRNIMRQELAEKKRSKKSKYALAIILSLVIIMIVSISLGKKN